MIKAWLAREWTNGKDQKMDSPSWDGGMWDENMLAMGQLPYSPLPSLSIPLPPMQRT